MCFQNTEIHGFLGQSLEATRHWKQATTGLKKDSPTNLLQMQTTEDRRQHSREKEAPALRRHFALQSVPLMFPQTPAPSHIQSPLLTSYARN